LAKLYVNMGGRQIVATTTSAQALLTAARREVETIYRPAEIEAAKRPFSLPVRILRGLVRELARPRTAQAPPTMPPLP
jgi:hypothetical protein